jgi:hypothetical protein
VNASGGTGSSNASQGGAAGGGGGGGFFGGGGGGAIIDNSTFTAGGGGGGGSGFTPDGTGLSTGDAPRGDGSVTLTWIPCPTQQGAVPTISRTGLLVLVILMVVGGMAVLHRRRAS